MTRLTKSQQQFMNQHGIPLSRVFDASGLSRQEYRPHMSSLGLVLAYGVSPCREAGHTLRLRTGHCAQCKPSGLSYLMRFDEPGAVYVAQSLAGGLVKVGSSIDPQRRVQALNLREYGDCNDWTLVKAAQCSAAGTIEHEIHKSLGRYHVERSSCDGERTYYELFECPLPVALNAFNQVLKSGREI